MLRLLSLLALAICMSGPALAQQSAAFDPANAVSKVKGTCAMVATHIVERNGLDGRCIAAAQDFLGLLNGRSRGEVDKNVTDLILELVPLAAADGGCNLFDAEIGRAIRLASNYVSTEVQRSLFLEVAATIEACDGNATAAIA